ncbi:hypothetical protein ACH5RR_017991 [Cinchona calisaya]|uniref:Reverse transcriptase n=1 Tax=Cinchona calisaya TaxID=153742 RepID=A0ABD2ZNV8_9GENT
MGFKDIQIFNSTILAKQIWRLLTRPNLLVSKVLRAKYYKGSLMETEVPKNASWYWQSIMSFKDVLKDVLTIWLDSWIPEYVNGKIETMKPHNCDIFTIDQLIYQG